MPELQQQNLDQTLCSESEQNVSFMTKPQLPDLHQTVANMILINHHQHQQQYQPQQVLSLHFHTQGSHQSSLLNRSEGVSLVTWVANDRTWVRQKIKLVLRDTMFHSKASLQCVFPLGFAERRVKLNDNHQNI